MRGCALGLALVLVWDPGTLKTSPALSGCNVPAQRRNGAACLKCRHVKGLQQALASHEVPRAVLARPS
eukprot:353363-Chlamydomonas_euryale.AAC.2